MEILVVLAVLVCLPIIFPLAYAFMMVMGAILVSPILIIFLIAKALIKVAKENAIRAS
jgi:hypothetical protein